MDEQDSTIALEQKLDRIIELLENTEKDRKPKFFRIIGVFLFQHFFTIAGICIGVYIIWHIWLGLQDVTEVVDKIGDKVDTLSSIVSDIKLKLVSLYDSFIDWIVNFKLF